MVLRRASGAARVDVLTARVHAAVLHYTPFHITGVRETWFASAMSHLTRIRKRSDPASAVRSGPLSVAPTTGGGAQVRNSDFPTAKPGTKTNEFVASFVRNLILVFVPGFTVGSQPERLALP